LLDGLHGVTHGADRLRQAGRQAPCEQVGKQQGKQRENRGFEQDLLLTLAECVVGHADNHPAQVVRAGRLGFVEVVLEKVVAQLDVLQADRRLEHFHRQRAVVFLGGLFDIHQNVLVAVLNLQEAHMGCGQRGAQQAVEHIVVAGDHPIFGGGRQLVGDQLAGVVQFLAQVLDTHEGEEADQQQGQQQRRAQGDELGAGVDVPTTTQGHGRFSPSANRAATPASSTCSMPSERATCGLPTTLKCSG